MKPELKKAWLADLRAHPKLKGVGLLRSYDVNESDQKFCCLGRLLLVADMEDEIHILQNDGLEELSVDVLHQLGLDLADQTALIEVNDQGAGGCLDEAEVVIPAPDYSEVIDWIEENL